MNTSSVIPVNHHAGYPGFAGVAGVFAGLTMLVSVRAAARLAVDLATVSEADRVVDIGCGPGSAVRAAVRHGAARATGVDPAPIMLRLARFLTPDRPGITWTRGAAEDLSSLADSSATVVWSLATVHHWKEVTAGLAEVRRVLAPGGRFLAMERRVPPGARGLASHGWIKQQAESFAAQCRAAGFHDVRSDILADGRRAMHVVTSVRP